MQQIAEQALVERSRDQTWELALTDDVRTSSRSSTGKKQLLSTRGSNPSSANSNDFANTTDGCLSACMGELIAVKVRWKNGLLWPRHSLA